jgi:hypothetical protein
MKDNSVSEAEFIKQACDAFGTSIIGASPNHMILDACEAFYMNGCADDMDGDADTFGHFYRAHRWIVHTDSQGFREVETFDNEDEAIAAFNKLALDYAATLKTEDCY